MQWVKVDYKKFLCSPSGIGLLVTLLIVGSWASGEIFFLLVKHRFLSVTPWTYWHLVFNISHNPFLQRSLFQAGVLGFLLVGIGGFKLFHRPTSNLYGDARFADAYDIKKAGLYCVGGYEHVMLFAPTGTGKTVSITLPNLFHWQGSCVVSDIKLTLFEQTSAYRQSLGQQVFLWNPAAPDGKTHCYNPLDIIQDNPYTRIDEIQKMAAIFIPDNPKSEPIWQAQSRFLFVALVLYVLDTPEIPKNLHTIVMLVKAAPDFSNFVKEILETRDDLDQLCRYNFFKFNELHERTRLSILATFLSYFELFDNPLIAAATSRSDFNIRDLRRQRMTVYVGVTNDNLVRLSPLLTVFYQQAAYVMTRKVPTIKEEPYGVLFLMDEFSTLRRMESFHKNIGLYREYRLRVMLIVQELSQLYDIYGRDGAKVFINAKIRIAFTQNDEETCNMIESALGSKTILVTNSTRKGNKGLFDQQGASKTEHLVKRPLMLAQEIRLLPKDKAIILVQGGFPIYATKVMWFKDRRLKMRMLGAIPVPSVLEEIMLSPRSKNKILTESWWAPMVVMPEMLEDKHMEIKKLAAYLDTERQ